MEDLRSRETPDPNPENFGRGRLRRFIKEILEITLISLFLFLSINAISARIRVESVSMQPTLFPGNFVVVDKLSYLIGSPNRGDIIVFRYPSNPELDLYIKRVIGLPGEEVRAEGGSVFINDVRIVEPYLETPTQQGGEWVVPENALFVMGDNRNNSSDSRAWGVVPIDNVIGKALIVYWPPEKWGLFSMSYAVAVEP